MPLTGYPSVVLPACCGSGPGWEYQVPLPSGAGEPCQAATAVGAGACGACCTCGCACGAGPDGTCGVVTCGAGRWGAGWCGPGATCCGPLTRWAVGAARSGGAGANCCCATWAGAPGDWPTCCWAACCWPACCWPACYWPTCCWPAGCAEGSCGRTGNCVAVKGCGTPIDGGCAPASWAVAAACCPPGTC